MAEIKPTMEQVRGIDQSTVFEQTEITKWVELAKRQHTEQAFFIDEYVAELSKFVSELTNSKWNARPFIEIDKINAFIDEKSAKILEFQSEEVLAEAYLEFYRETVLEISE